MSRFNFQSPLSAAADEMTKFVAEREARKRQQMIDEIMQRNSESMIEDRQLDRQSLDEDRKANRRNEELNIEALNEQRRTNAADRIAGVLNPGQEMDQESEQTLRAGGMGGLVLAGKQTYEGMSGDDASEPITETGPSTFRGTAQQHSMERLRETQEAAAQAAAVRAENPRAQPGMVGEYEYYAEQTKAAGKTPMSFEQYQNEDANRRAIRPPAPLVIYTPGGPQIVDKTTGTAKPVTGQDGKDLPLPLTADMRNRSVAYQRSAPVLSAIGELSEKINTGSGLIAKMAGGAAKVAAQANYNDDVAEYEALVSGFTPLIARAVGHVGVLTELDVQSVRKMFPAPGDSKMLRDRKINRINQLIGDIGAAGVEGGAPSATPEANPAEALRKKYGY